MVTNYTQTSVHSIPFIKNKSWHLYCFPYSLPCRRRHGKVPMSLARQNGSLPVHRRAPFVWRLHWLSSRGGWRQGAMYVL